MSKQTKLNKKQRQEFLLTFFTGDGYQEKQINGFWLVKHSNGNSGKYQIDIFTEESFRNYKERKSLGH